MASWRCKDIPKQGTVILSIEGVHQAFISPSQQYIIDRYSQLDLPPSLDLLST